MSDPDPLLALKRRFATRARSDAEALEVAIDRGDQTEIERLVHGLAGAAGIFGFASLSATALALDEAFARGETPEPPALHALVAEAKTINQS